MAAIESVITGMDYGEEAGGSMHLGRKDVERLMQRHPSTRFIITHRGSNGSVSGAVMARDFLTLRLPLQAPGPGEGHPARPSPPAPGSCPGCGARRGTP